jgi:predicted SAM-dependent methyltransferase
MSDRQVKLNLGCYDKKIPNFINVDIRPETGCDVIDDIFKLESFETESADLIYACHSLEHADYKEADAALKRWFEVLKPGGVLRLAVPDMEAHFAHYYYHRDLRLLHSTFWGSQKHPYDYHKNGWDFKKLKEDLSAVGFSNIHRYDWRDTEHFYIDDYSQTYYPHLDKVNGKLMSLNVEATK